MSLFKSTLSLNFIKIDFLQFSTKKKLKLVTLNKTKAMFEYMQVLFNDFQIVSIKITTGNEYLMSYQ